MFPYYQGKSEDFALGYDDILAMYQLYSKDLNIVFLVLVVGLGAIFSIETVSGKRGNIDV